LERLIYSTGFYKNKARSIRAFCKQLVSDYKGKVPDTLDELVKMPGIGRKTANVVLNELHGKSEGIVVDTHVARISRVLEFTTQTDPVKIERDLMKSVPRKLWLDWALLIIFLGRKYCGARRRLCDQCPLNDICPSAEIAK
ncbi:MAG: endonuclease III, partial [Leptospiraceae bacterium]|nr:endonuclease III [Leptospiraceae bacterium]